MSFEHNAVEIAKEMVESHLKNGATHLDLDFIADQACELAYKIHERAKAYGLETYRTGSASGSVTSNPHPH